MNNDDTPLTNEASFGWHCCEDGNKYVDDFFARKLERKINAAMKIVDSKLAKKVFSISETCLLLDMRECLTGDSTSDTEDAGVVQHRRVHPEEC